LKKQIVSLRQTVEFTLNIIKTATKPYRIVYHTNMNEMAYD